MVSGLRLTAILGVFLAFIALCWRRRICVDHAFIFHFVWAFSFFLTVILKNRWPCKFFYCRQSVCVLWSYCRRFADSTPGSIALMRWFVVGWGVWMNCVLLVYGRWYCMGKCYYHGTATFMQWSSVIQWAIRFNLANLFYLWQSIFFVSGSLFSLLAILAKRFYLASHFSGNFVLSLGNPFQPAFVFFTAANSLREMWIRPCKINK